VKAAWARTVDPVLPAITIAEARAQARITGTQSDGDLDTFIRTASDAAEQVLGRGLLTQTWRLDLDQFYDEMALPMAAPLQNSQANTTEPIVQYYDTSGVLTTLASSAYLVDTISRPGRILRAPSHAWPAVQADRLSGAVRITYVVGWTSADLIPDRIKHGIRMYVTYLDADRDGMETQARAAEEAAQRCWSDRVYWVEPSCG
jgi:uncharacterized phiE125 gp8 family phage protein